MIEIIWEYVVREEKTTEFLRYYASDGVWAEFFRKGDGYRGAALLRDSAKPGRFVTIDTWDDLASYEAFRKQHAAQYGEIDGVCEAFTLEERHIGTFEVL